MVVAAAGNGALSPGPDADPADGTNDAPSYPAADPGVIAVGATGRDGYRAAYSNTGSYVAMVAPGGTGDRIASDDVPLLTTGDSYTTGSGTSFAAPQVSAAAALIWSVNPNLSAAQVAELLTSTTTDLGPTGTDIEYGTGILSAGVALADTPPTTTGFGTFTSVTPARILDTRSGLGAPKATIGAGKSIDVAVMGQGGIPSTGVAAVVLNATVTNTTAPSFVTVWPTGQTRPNSSNINFSAEQTIPNLVTVKVGSTGKVSIYNSAGSTDVVADVAGYYIDGTGAAGSTFVPVTPDRLMDTRATSPIATGATRNLQVGGAGPVPNTATAVVLNVTATGPTAASVLTVFPEGTTRPLTSNLNYVAGETVPNLVTVQLGSTGGLSFFNAFGSVNVIADLEGYFTAAGDTSGSRFFPLVNHRIVDTRANIGGSSGRSRPGSRSLLRSSAREACSTAPAASS